MGDSSLITLLPLLPLLIIVFSIVTAIFVWLTEQRAVRMIFAILLMIAGVFFIFSPFGMFFSMGGGVLIAI